MRPLAQRLCTQLAIMSQVKVIRQRIDRGLPFGTPKLELPTASLVAAFGSVSRPFPHAGRGGFHGRPQRPGRRSWANCRRIFPCPILLVQHITD